MILILLRRFEDSSPYHEGSVRRCVTHSVISCLSLNKIPTSPGGDTIASGYSLESSTAICDKPAPHQYQKMISKNSWQ